LRNGRAALQNAFVLRAIAFAQWRGKKFIGAAANQFGFRAPAAAVDERLIHHHIFATAILDEEHNIGQAIEQRLARERPGEFREQFVVKLGGGHAVYRYAKILVTTSLPDKTAIVVAGRIKAVQ
jgi:hypothetical protein